jgi:hypothetical protein
MWVGDLLSLDFRNSISSVSMAGGVSPLNEHGGREEERVEEARIPA